MPTKISQLPVGQAVGDIATGTLVVRQTGGTPGTDEVQVYHDGDNTYITNKTAGGQLILGNQTQSAYFTIGFLGRAFQALNGPFGSANNVYFEDANGIAVSDGTQIGWGASGNNIWSLAGVKSTGLSQGGAGLVNVTNGSTTTYAQVGSNTAAFCINNAIPANGSLNTGIKATSTANFGVYFGSGAPTLSAAKGSLYLRSDGTGIADRAYIATDSAGAWTNLVTGG